MTDHDQTARSDALCQRPSKLCAASLRISARLDLAVVLDEICKSARELTDAHYTAIVTIDQAGCAEGTKLFEHFRDLPGAVRIPDVPAYVHSLGFSSDRLPSRSFQGTPMRHRGEQVGNFCLVEKEGGGEFTVEDEEVLILFAAQAAMAIANARTHRAEQRVRADLEALVETSPVGVAVFEARTGRLVLVNQEAKRIVREPGAPGDLPALLEMIRCRFADGREIALDQLPLSDELIRAKTVRAEEIVLSIPDGKSVTTLVNATPIASDNGDVESVVVTIQDLAPLHKADRMRAEFLGLVSHELRAPLTSTKARPPLCSRPRHRCLGRRRASSTASFSDRPIRCEA